MTDNQEVSSMQMIEFCRSFNRKMAQKQAEIGARIEDISIGAIYSAVDLAQVHTGDLIAAIEWTRTAPDVMERDLLPGGTVQ